MSVQFIGLCVAKRGKRIQNASESENKKVRANKSLNKKGMKQRMLGNRQATVDSDVKSQCGSLCDEF